MINLEANEACKTKLSRVDQFLARVKWRKKLRPTREVVLTVGFPQCSRVPSTAFSLVILPRLHPQIS